MQINNIDTTERVFIIAEIGNNHEGSFQQALSLIDAAAKTGVDAVKFQTFLPEHYVSRAQKERFARLSAFQLSFDEFEALAVHAKEQGLLFLSTPFDLHSADFLARIVDGIKIGSCENTFYPLIERVAQMDLPLIVSTGLASLSEISYTKALIDKTRAMRGISADLALLHCVSAYPTPPSEANLLAIKTMREHFDCTVGYSDHTQGITAAGLSVALGAQIIEKHFTLDKNYSDFRDHQLSACPDEMTALVNHVRACEQYLGDGLKSPQPSEAAQAHLVRRSIVTQRALKAGETLALEAITWTRPAETGFRPGEEAKLLGRRLKVDVLADTPLTEALFEV